MGSGLKLNLSLNVTSGRGVFYKIYWQHDTFWMEGVVEQVVHEYAGHVNAKTHEIQDMVNTTHIYLMLMCG